MRARSGPSARRQSRSEWVGSGSLTPRSEFLVPPWVHWENELVPLLVSGLPPAGEGEKKVRGPCVSHSGGSLCELLGDKLQLVMKMGKCLTG